MVQNPPDNFPHKIVQGAHVGSVSLTLFYQKKKKLLQQGKRCATTVLSATSLQLAQAYPGLLALGSSHLPKSSPFSHSHDTRCSVPSLSTSPCALSSLKPSRIWLNITKFFGRLGALSFLEIAFPDHFYEDERCAQVSGASDARLSPTDHSGEIVNEVGTERLTTFLAHNYHSIGTHSSM